MAQSAETPKAIGAEIDAKAKFMVRKLRRYHRLGQKATTPNAIRRLSRKHGLSLSSIRKMREFSSRYTPDELGELCDIRRPNHLPIHWGYVPYLLTVRSKTKRAEFQEAIKTHGWTAPELYAQIRARRKPGGIDRGGRRAKKSASPELELDVYLPEAIRYLKRCKAACEVLRGQPPKQRKRLQRLQEKAKEVQSLARVVQQLVDLLTG